MKHLEKRYQKLEERSERMTEAFQAMARGTYLEHHEEFFKNLDIILLELNEDYGRIREENKQLKKSIKSLTKRIEQLEIWKKTK